MKAKGVYLRNTIMLALVPLSLAACSGMMPQGLTGSPAAQSPGTVAQPGDSALSCTQLAEENKQLDAKLRDLEANKKRADVVQSGAQLTEQAAQVAPMVSDKASSFIPFGGLVSQATTAGAAMTSNKLEASYQAALSRKQYLASLAARKNCARK